MDSANQVAKQSKEEKLAYWRDHQCQWEVSGLSRTAYCQREGLKLSSFDYQRACIRAAEAVKAMFKADAPEVKVMRFVPATRTDGAAITTANSMMPSTLEMIHVHSPNGWQVNLTLKQVTHDPGAVTSLFQLLQACR